VLQQASVLPNQQQREGQEQVQLYLASIGGTLASRLM